jgi:hypothetical protein
MDIGHALDRARQDLCGNCRKVDLEQVFATGEILKTGIEILDIAKRPSNLNKSRCNSCWIFHQFGPDYLRRHSLHVRLFDRVEDPSSFLRIQMFPQLLTHCPSQEFQTHVQPRHKERDQATRSHGTCL